MKFHAKYVNRIKNEFTQKGGANSPHDGEATEFIREYIALAVQRLERVVRKVKSLYVGFEESYVEFQSTILWANVALKRVKNETLRTVRPTF